MLHYTLYCTAAPGASDALAVAFDRCHQLSAFSFVPLISRKAQATNKTAPIRFSLGAEHNILRTVVAYCEKEEAAPPAGRTASNDPWKQLARAWQRSYDTLL